MKKYYFTKVSLGSLLCVSILLAGCSINIGCWPRVKYEKTVQLSAPMSPGSVFAAQTHNGSITINGADVTDCNLTATIIARALTEKDARKLADQIGIKLETSGNKLEVKIKKPVFMTNQSVSVNLNVTVPQQLDATLITHNGAIRIANITGNTKATTHNGKIVCEEIQGDINLRTHNGRINAVYSKNAPPVCNVSAVTHNGGISFTCPPNFSAQVDVSTHNGSIRTDLPITVTGKISKSLKGTIGEGKGKLHLETHNGSIKIK